ncbi:MAG: GNAT family N-acetyltransferase [Bacteroidales bacterium]|nr:GNAT family N-acetyltransferase [Bacteroidales bacterium]
MTFRYFDFKDSSFSLQKEKLAFSVAEDLYISSFPKEERRSLSSVYCLIEKEYFEFLPLFSDTEFVGFITLWHFDEFIYAEHFAVKSNQRNKGIGSSFIKCLTANEEKPIVLEVEKPLNETTVRRIEFYKRLGFKMYDNYYFQPPYNEDSEGLELKIMVFEKGNTSLEFEKIKQTLYSEVYKVSKEYCHSNKQPSYSKPRSI